MAKINLTPQFDDMVLNADGSSSASRKYAEAPNRLTLAIDAGGSLFVGATQITTYPRLAQLNAAVAALRSELQQAWDAGVAASLFPPIVT